MAREFYMTLSCNNKTDKDNTIAVFDTLLDKVYELEGEWYMGLAVLSYTKSWFNVNKVVKVMLVDEAGVSYPCLNFIPAGYYAFESELETTLKSLIHSISCDAEVYPTLTFDMNTRRVIITDGHTKQGSKLYLWLSEEFQAMLGLIFHGPHETVTHDENGNIRSNTIKPGLTSIRSYDLSAGIHSLYVYCDLVDPSFVGDTYTNILRSVNVNRGDEFSRDVELVFNPIQYLKLSKNKFHWISVGFYDDAGEVIPFKFGRTKVVLHFKQENASRLGEELLYQTS